MTMYQHVPEVIWARGNKMTEAEAWLILAEKYDAGQQRSKFLCVCLESDYTMVPEIPSDLRQKMVDRIVYSLGDRFTAYNYDEDDQQEGRVLACLMFAAQAEDGVGYAD